MADSYRDPQALGPTDADGWRSAQPVLPASPPTFDGPRYGILQPDDATDPLPQPTTAANSGVNIRVAVMVGVLGALTAALVAGAIFIVFGREGTGVKGAETAENTKLVGEPLDIQALLAKAQPSVVSIQTGTTASERLYGGAGTGLVISEDGLVLTNAHVIQGFSTMSITLFDGTVREADLVGSSPSDDIALIQIRGASGLKPAELGRSADVLVGDDVVAIGNALNLGGPPSVTDGIVSATDRSIDAPGVSLRGLIQTDAAINPGNSGGPLLNARGEVIGINTAIVSDAQNIGFAIAIDLVKPLIEELKAGKGDITLDSAFLGVVTVALDAITQNDLDTYGITTDEGVFVTDVLGNSSAADAGLQVGDVITVIDGQRITATTDVASIVRSHEAGDEITITYERSGRERTVTIELRSRRDSGD